MVSRNTVTKFRFICFTENSEGIRPEVEIQDPPELELPSGSPERGWRKLTVFKENFGGLSGPTLFLDLDVVIEGSLDVFFSQPGDFLIAHDKKNLKEERGELLSISIRNWTIPTNT